MIPRCWAFPGILILIGAFPLAAQSVISVRSGVVHYSEGSVLLDNQPVEHRFGKFQLMKDGSELRTEEGRAELMLTPGVFLRVGQNSSIRMISNRLTDTRVEFLSGSAVLDSMAATVTAAPTMLFGGYQARLHNQGRYRFSTEPPEIKVESGEIEVVYGTITKAVSAGQLVPLSGEFVTRPFVNERDDALEAWNKTRNNSISENDLQASSASDLSSVMDDWDNDPQALLRALMSNSVPPLSSLPAGGGYGQPPGHSSLSIYSPLSTFSPLSIYSPWIGSPTLGSAPLGIWGLGFGSPIGIYAPPLLRYYSRPAVGLPSYRSPVIGARPAIGGAPIYQPAPRTIVSPSPIHSAPGRVGHR